MIKFVVGTVLASLLVEHSLGLGLDLELLDKNDQLDDERTIILHADSNTSIFGLNLTQLIPLLTLLSATLLPLLAFSALCVFLLGHVLDSKSGYQSDYGSIYSSYQRALGIDTLDWEKLSIIDWTALGEETFSKFDPSNLSCQTRLICELHQNSNYFGKVGDSIVKTFGYLRYLEVFNLPDMVRGLITEYQDAADRGRSVRKDCGEVYPDCEFSVKELFDQYKINQIH